MLRRFAPLFVLALIACRADPPRAPIDDGAGGDAGTEYAPYFYTWGWGAPGAPFSGLADLEGKTGLRAVTLAFVLADRTCTATMDVARHIDDINGFRKRGGRVRASFGGAAGLYLENACDGAPALVEALSGFVDRTGIVDLDFDVEQQRAMTPAVNRARAQALAALQAKRRVKIAFTLAASPRDPATGAGGLSAPALDVVRASVAAGVVISRVNLMTMGYASPPGRAASTSALAIDAITTAKSQIQAIMPALDEGAAWALLGVTPMIGDNGPGALAFTLTDAEALASFVRQRHLGFVGYWAINRDQPGAGSLSNKSHAQTKAFAFHKVFESVAP